MANIRLIKGRIKSAKNIAQITKAMELVAASKMRKAQLAAISGKLYAQKIYEMVLRLSTKIDVVAHPLLAKPETPTGKRLVVLISTNKGMCGGLNTTLFRQFLHDYPETRAYECVTVGRKGASFITSLGGMLKADFSQTTPFSTVVPALTELVTKEFIAGGYDTVDLVYNEFVSIVKQVTRKKVILPLTIESVASENKEEPTEFLIEPSVAEVFESLVPHYLENQVRDAILQAEASEYSARMIAMRNATDNAMSLTDELTLLYNKARQEKITYEITDLITAQLTVS